MDFNKFKNKFFKNQYQFKIKLSKEKIGIDAN